jgi:cytochrome c5
LISEAEQKASREKRSKLADQPYNLAAVMRVFAISLTLAIVGGSFEGAHPAARQSAAPVASASASRHRAVVDRYCVTCHNARLRTAGLSLAQADTERPSVSAEVWEKAIRKLRTGAMPPAGIAAARPGDARRLRHVSGDFDRSRRSRTAEPGATGAAPPQSH